MGEEIKGKIKGGGERSGGRERERHFHVGSANMNPNEVALCLKTIFMSIPRTTTDAGEVTCNYI